jgi:hypothetical protein
MVPDPSKSGSRLRDALRRSRSRDNVAPIDTCRLGKVDQFRGQPELPMMTSSSPHGAAELLTGRTHEDHRNCSYLRSDLLGGRLQWTE